MPTSLQQSVTKNQKTIRPKSLLLLFKEKEKTAVLFSCDRSNKDYGNLVFVTDWCNETGVKRAKHYHSLVTLSFGKIKNHNKQTCVPELSLRLSLSFSRLSWTIWKYCFAWLWICLRSAKSSQIAKKSWKAWNQISTLWIRQKSKLFIGFFKE